MHPDRVQQYLRKVTGLEFAGLIEDADLAMPMVYYQKGRELITNSYRYRITPNRLFYPVFELAFLTWLDQIDWTTILDVADNEDLHAADRHVSKVKSELISLQDQAQKLTDLLLDTASTSLKERLVRTEDKSLESRPS